MAAILKLRRGITNASPALENGELYLHNGVGSIQFGSGSITHTLLPLNTPIVGNINLIGNITASNAYFSGDVNIDGNLQLGNQTGDVINVVASLSSSLIPIATNEHDLGSQTRYWKSAYITSITGSLSGSVNNIDITNFSQSVDSRLDNLQLFSSSEETKNSTLSTYTSSVDSRLNNIELTSQSHDSRLDNLEEVSSSHTSDLIELFSTASNHEVRIDNLEVYSGSINTKWDTLQNVTASLIEKTGSYATTGSNIFVGNQTISASIDVSGSVGADSFELEGNSTTIIPALNPEFNLDFSGSIAPYIYKTVLLNDGKVLAAGRFQSVDGHITDDIVRLNSDGSVDTTFSAPTIGAPQFGQTSGDIIYSIAIQSDNKIIIVGGFDSVGGVARTGVARLNTDGTLDTTFGNPGLTSMNTVRDVVIQPDGKLIVVGYFTGGIKRLNTNGTIDTSLVVTDQNGFTNDSMYTVALQTVGSTDYILVGGSFLNWQGLSAYKRIVRLGISGSIDYTFGGSNLAITSPGGLVRKIKLDSNNNIYIGGTFVSSTQQSGIARLLTNGLNLGPGEIDPTFTTYLSPSGQTVYDFAIVDNRVLIGGTFVNSGETSAVQYPASRFVIVNENDGSRSDIFSYNEHYASSAVRSIIPIPSTSNVLIAGDFTNAGGDSREYIASLKISEVGEVTTINNYVFTADATKLLVSSSNTHFTGDVNISGSVYSPSFSGSFTGSFNGTIPSQDGRLNNLELFTASEETKNTTLQSYTSSVDNRLTNLELNSGSQESDLIELFSTASNHEGRIDNLENYTSSLKNVLELTGSNMVVIGDLSVRGTTTTINSTTIQLGDNIIELNGSGVTNGGIHVKDATGVNLETGSLIWNTTNDYWEAGVIGSESRILLAGGDGIVSSSTQVVDVLISLNSYTSSQDTKNSTIGNYTGSLETYTASLDTKNNTLGNYTASLDTKHTTLGGYTASINVFTASEEAKNTTLGTYTASLNNSVSLLNTHTSSQDTKNSTLETYTSSLNLYTSSLETKNSTLATYTGSVNGDLARFELVSGSYKTLIGEYSISSSLGSAAFYYVTNSLEIVEASGSINYIDSHLLTAGAVKKYVDWRTEEIITAIGAADITSVTAGPGLAGGGPAGDVTLSLDTASVIFTDGIKTKLDVEGVISGSSQLTASYDGRYSLSGSVFEPFSESVDSRIVSLETTSTENPLTFTDTTTIELIRVVDTITANAIGGVVSGSSQIIDILTPLNSFSSSEETKNTNLATYTGSNDTKWSTLGGQSGSWITESETGSFARTDVANIFTATQTITGSMFISGDLVVQGSSSLQDITASAVTIGTNQIILNTDFPAFRYAGINVYDSGSSGVSASLQWDSLTDQWIFVHQESGSTTVDSSILLYGPLSTDGLGSEQVLTANYITKVEDNGHGHHLTTSSIEDTGTKVTIYNPLDVNGSITATSFTGSIAATNGVVSGSSQITLSSTTGGGTSANVQFGSLGIGMSASGTIGRIDATNDIVAFSSSDRNFKENIKPIENALDKINQIGGYEFDWKVENKNEHGYEGHDLGVIAQEIEMIAPELVQTRENGYKAVKYDKLVSVLIQAIKELSQKLNDLENK